MTETTRGFERLENGDVRLTMSDDDYDRLLLILGAATAAFRREKWLISRDKILGFMNRVVGKNNPNMRPYKVSERESSADPYSSPTI